MRRSSTPPPKPPSQTQDEDSASDASTHDSDDDKAANASAHDSDDDTASNASSHASAKGDDDDIDDIYVDDKDPEEHSPLEETVNLKLFDVDGCTYHSLPKREVKEPITNFDWFIENNEALFTDIEEEIAANNYSKVIVGLGTNREDFHVEKLNYTEYGWPSAPVMPLIQSRLASKFGDERVVFDMFMMADLYANERNGGKILNPGSSYLFMLLDNLDKPELPHAYWMFDLSKVSLIYAHLHRVALLHPGKKIIVDFYDDDEEKLLSVYNFFNAYPQLMPDNVELRVHHYENGKLHKNPRPPIVGTGEIDRNFEWSVRYLTASRHCVYENKFIPPFEINSAQALVDYFHQKQYFERIQHCELNITANRFDVDAFLKFRRDEIAKIRETWCQKSAYITAAALLKADRIPDYYLAKPKPAPAEHRTQTKPLQEEDRPAPIAKPYDAAAFFSNQESITLFMHRLSQDESMPCADDVNIADMIRNLAKLPYWNDKGISFFFWRKPPTGVSEIAALTSDDIPHFADIVRQRRGGVVSSKYDQLKVRMDMTADFYDLVLTAAEPRISRQTTYTALHVFCQKWGISTESLFQRNAPVAAPK